jgi:hypothetical protein
MKLIGAGLKAPAMNHHLKGCSVADVLQRLEKGKIGHRAAMEWFSVSAYAALDEIMHVNGRLMPAMRCRREGCRPARSE